MLGSSDRGSLIYRPVGLVPQVFSVVRGKILSYTFNILILLDSTNQVGVRTDAYDAALPPNQGRAGESLSGVDRSGGDCPMEGAGRDELRSARVRRQGRRAD